MWGMAKPITLLTSFGLESYLAALFLKDKLYGTINFSPGPAITCFQHRRVELIQLFAKWMGDELLAKKPILNWVE